MLEEMVKAVVNKVIAQDYAFLKTPAALYAVVTKATQLELPLVREPDVGVGQARHSFTSLMIAGVSP